MPGQATVTIGENSWTVSVATTYAELVQGLSGVLSMPAGTGMLFVLPAAQAVSVDTTGMNFPIDIIFISNNTVIDIARNIQPGYLVTEETPCDSFLEVNAGEADGVEPGDTVSTATIQEPGFDWSQITSFVIPLAALGFVCAIAGGVMKPAGGSVRSSKSLIGSQLSSPAKNQITTTELQEVIDNLRPQFGRFKETIDRSLDEGREIGYIIDDRYRLTGPFIGSAKGVTYDLTKEELEYMGAIGTFHTHIEREKPMPSRMNWMWMGIRGDKILCVGGKARERYYLYVGLRREELPSGKVKIDETTIPLFEHHSMWLTLEQRKELEKKYGAVAVRWAEEATKPGDIEAADKAAAYYYGRIREYFALGHGSPELTEEQIMKLRETLGLPKEVPPREKGYID